MSVKFTNNAYTTLTSTITAGATSFDLASVASFPVLGAGDWTYMSLTNEVVKVTAITGLTCTCDPVAGGHAAGINVELRMTAELLNDFAEDTEAVPVTGGTFTGAITAPDFIGALNGAVQFTAKNDEGGAITKGQAVYIKGISGDVATVGLADANDSAKMPAFGLVLADANNNSEVEIVTFGSLKDTKTDYAGWALGDTLYVSTTAGALTNSAPTGESSLIQNIGKIQRVHASAGIIKAGGAGRTNATPNLDDGNVFIGNASNQAAARALQIADTTGLQTALDGKEPADATILKDADIGVNVQAYDATILKDADIGVTVQGLIADNGLSGDKIDGGTISNFASTGIDDNATSTKLTVSDTGIDVTGTVNTTTVDLGNWTVTESLGVLYFATSGINKAKLDASGNFTVAGDITAYGTI